MRIGHRSVPGPRLSTPLHAVPAITLGILASVLAPIANAGLPEREQAGSGTGTVDIDRTTRVDANRIDMSTTNHGSFGYDIPNGDAGLIYPRSGQNTALFAGGLWIGALVNDSDLRISLAEYSFEYIPGRIEPDGSWDTNYDSNPRWRTYKIYRGDLPGSNPDYDEWPVQDGAPVDANGAPFQLGDQTLFSVYHDADPNAHNNGAGNTVPLGVEVQQTTFASDQVGAGSDIVFIQWKIVNKSDDDWHDAYVACWTDPDLGGAADDFVGCDPEQSLGYCYNATNNDNQYGSTPPALGIDLVQGPIVPSPGDVAWVSGVEVPDYRNLPMTAFLKYINGTDPNTADHSYNYMQGLTRDGGPIVDPLTGEITTFMVQGDPVEGEGWLDTDPADRRMMVSAGPFDLAIGESQTVAVAIVMGQGGNRLDSVRRMRENAAEAEGLFRAAWGADVQGACCLTTGPCTISTADDCSGTFLVGETCLPGTCSNLPGACCFDSGVCLVLLADDCSGDFLGSGAECYPDLCPEYGPESACCLGNGECELLSERDCLEAGGSYLPDQPCHLLPPGDPPGWQTNNAGSPMFDQVQSSEGPVGPDGQGGPGDHVWHSYDDSGIWLLSAGGGDGGIDRFTRDGADLENLTTADLELRWDNDPDNYGWWAFEGDETGQIPFGLYLVDPNTGESDRLIPVFFSGGGTVGVFDISYDTIDPFSGFAATDWTYAYTGDYEAFLADAYDGTMDVDFLDRELFARLIIASEGPFLPEEGTVIRFVTTKSGIAAGSGFAGEVPLAWTAPDGIVGCFDPPSYDIRRNGSLLGTTHRTDFLDRNAAPGVSYEYTVTTVNPFTGEDSEPSAAVVAQASTSGESVACGSAPGAPVLDGQISTGEWDGAQRVDASPAGTFTDAHMLFMNDEDYLYVAIVGAEPGNVTVCFDGNRNQVYDGGFEGELAWRFQTPSFTRTRGAYPTTKFQVAQLATWADIGSGAAPNVQELRISLTNGPLQGLHGADAFGLYVSASDGATYPRGPRSVLREAPWLFAEVTLTDPIPENERGNGSEEPFSDEDTAGLEGLLPLGIQVERSIGLPNPSNGAVTIAYRVPTSQSVSVHVYGTDGRLVRTVSSAQTETEGLHAVRWDGVDGQGRKLAPGIYYYEVRGETFRWTDRITVIR